MNRGIDHLVICVQDLDEAARRYEALGFTLTPRAQHPWGTDNRLVQLQGNFLELLTISRPELIASPHSGGFDFGAFNQTFVNRHPGVSMLVFESDDAKRDRAEFDRRGIGGYPPFDFERQATLPDGAAVTLAFSLAFSHSDALPEAMFFCCQQRAPEYFWKPEFQSHANGAEMVDEVLMVADDLDAAADYFARLQEPHAVRRVGSDLCVITPRGNITVLARDTAASRVPGAASVARDGTRQFLGFGIRVRDVTALGRRLRSASIPFEQVEGSSWVSPDDLFGALIRFHE